MTSKKATKRGQSFIPGRAIAGTLRGLADYHYGYYYTLKDIEKDFPRTFDEYKRGTLKYSTSEAERKRLAKTSFKGFGLTFKSLDEVKKVAALFKERHGEEWFSERYGAKLKRKLASILKETRKSR